MIDKALRPLLSPGEGGWGDEVDDPRKGANPNEVREGGEYMVLKPEINKRHDLRSSHPEQQDGNKHDDNHLEYHGHFYKKAPV